MENKLQELTKKLYDEGLEKGRAEADRLIADAKNEAEKIVAKAKAEAHRIVGEAADEAADLRKNTLLELDLAGRQVVSRLKRTVRELVTARATGGAVKAAAMDPAFVKEVLIAAAKNWQGGGTLQAVLPEAMRGRLDDAFAGSVLGGGELEIAFSERVKSGFTLGPRDGNYHVDFTEDGFDALLSDYLRPRVDEILGMK